MFPKGEKAGLIGSAFSLGALFGNMFWGFMADRIGRRQVLLCGIIGTMFSCLLFGFSWNFWMALTSRFLWGALNGNIGVSKVYLGEILDDTNSARGMSVYGIIGGVGRIIGPLIGGFLSSPAKTFSFMKGTIFETFPYCLPQIILAFGCFTMLILAYIYLPETEAFISMKQNRMDLKHCTDKYTVLNPLQVPYDKIDNFEEIVDMESSSSKTSVACSTDSTEKLINLSNEEYIDNDFDHDYDDSASYGSKKRVTFSGIVTIKVIDSNALAYSRLKQVHKFDEPIDDLEYEKDESGAHQSPRISIRYDNGSRLLMRESRTDSNTQSTYRYVLNIFKQRDVFVSTILYGLNAYCQIIMNEVFPLWVVTSKSDGGFNFNTQKIGTVILFSGPISILVSTHSLNY